MSFDICPYSVLRNTSDLTLKVSIQNRFLVMWSGVALVMHDGYEKRETSY